MSFGQNYSLLFLWQVNQKMMLTLTASIMYWSLQHKAGELESFPSKEEDSEARISTSDIDDQADLP